MRAVNLIPSEQRRGASVGAGRSEGGAYAVLGLIAAIAVLAFLFGQAKHQVSSRSGEVTSLNAKATAVKAEASTLAPYTSFLKLRDTRTAAVSTLVDSRFDWAHAFHEFGRVIPKGISISSLDGAVGGSAATPAAAPAAPATTGEAASATPPGSVPNFTVAGCGTSQRTVASFLQRLRLIDGVSEVTLQSSTKGGGGGAAGGGGCATGQPSFALTVTFQALPSTAEAAAAAKGKSTKTSTVANSTGASSAPSPSTPATGGAQ
jgi:hypothetical protein